MLNTLLNVLAVALVPVGQPMPAGPVVPTIPPVACGPHLAVPAPRLAVPAPHLVPARPTHQVVRTERGACSIYDEAQTTAWGRWYDGTGLVAAHRTAPRGQLLRVTNLATGQAVVVVCHDRGPYAGDWVNGRWVLRLLDLAPGAAARIGLPGPGRTADDQVMVEWLVATRE